MYCLAGRRVASQLQLAEVSTFKLSNPIPMMLLRSVHTTPRSAEALSQVCLCLRSKTRQPLQLTLRSRRYFRHSPPALMRLDDSTIEFAHLPSTAQLSLDPSAPGESDPFSRLRVPLLPDNFAPDRSQLDGHLPEETDGPIAAPEILVVAANPESVVPAALTEVEGAGPDGIELNFLHGESDGEVAAGEAGMIRDIWHGLIDDIFGSSKTSTAKGPS